MSDLLADLLNADTFNARGGSRCRVSRIIESLDEKTADALKTQIDNTLIDAAALARVLEKHGHKVNAHTIRRHRRRSNGDGCACP